MKLRLSYTIGARFMANCSRVVRRLLASYLVNESVLRSDPFNLVDDNALDLVIAFSVREVECYHDREIIVVVFVQFDKEFPLFFREICFT
jgi:hypothetical protein